MKVLVATRQTQGTAKTDFCFAQEDELVYKAEGCSECSNANCRCKFALAGTRSKMFTNTVKVAEKDYFIDEVDAMHHSMPKMRAVAEEYEIGTVLEIKPDGFHVRTGDFIWQEIFLED